MAWACGGGGGPEGGSSGRRLFRTWTEGSGLYLDPGAVWSIVRVVTEAGQDRLHSLDAFRGATIAAMLFVNNPGSWSNVYSPFRHAEWHGCTPTDLVFPFFLFIVGVSMAFSLRAYMGPGRKPGLPSRVFRRVTMLILLGLFLNGFPSFDLDTIRLPGVLQRIGLVYAMAVPLVMLLGARGLVGVSAGILLGYWAVLGLVPVEGCRPRGTRCRTCPGRSTSR